VSFFKRLFGGRSGSGRSAVDRNAIWVYVRCDACGEKIKLRIDREHDLSADFDGASDFPSGFQVHKEIVGRNCFRRITVDVTFNSGKQPVDQQIRGGTFLTEEEFNAAGAA
jgi:hypothetical protein